jgi:hypothetical protein
VERASQVFTLTSAANPAFRRSLYQMPTLIRAEFRGLAKLLVLMDVGSRRLRTLLQPESAP